MKKSIIFFLCLLFLGIPSAFSKKMPETLVPPYHITGAGIISDGSQQVLITIFSKKKENVSDAELEKAAVHAVLFRDYDDGTNTSSTSAAHHPCLMGSPTAETEYKDFFTDFFNNGDYRNYVQIVSDSRRVVKSGKEWKVSAKVHVNSPQLKKTLKKAGMLKDLGSW